MADLEKVRQCLWSSIRVDDPVEHGPVYHCRRHPGSRCLLQIAPQHGCRDWEQFPTRRDT